VGDGCGRMEIRAAELGGLVADVFISYAREDRAMASELAAFLEGKGFDVWWDAELLGSDDFHDVIQAALSRAKAAIVLWSKNSVKSRFVRDEARFALHYDKLVATKTPDVDVFEIPFGFQGQHTDDIGQRDRILLAIERLGAKPNPGPLAQANPVAAPQVGPESAALVEWEKVKTSPNPDELLDYLARYPDSPQRTACLALVRRLATEPRAPDVPALRVRQEPSKWRAFLSGFSFRMPGYQTLTTGTYAAFGGAALYIALSIAAPAIIMSQMRPEPYGYTTLATVCALIALLGLQRFWAWRKQRNFRAAVITGLAVAGITGLMAFCLGVIARGSKEQMVALWPITAVGVMIVLGIWLYRAR
jgi:hypothetical protein